MLASTLTSCAGPKIEDVEERLATLIEASYGVNELLFGKGPETYERIYDPKASMEYYTAPGGQRYYYFYIEDESEGTILAYRTKSYGDDYSYLSVSDKEISGKDAVYSDGEKYYYNTEYVFKEAEFYYDDSFPADYDVVLIDSEIKSVEGIKEYAETVYSRDYLAAIYETLFTGVMISDDTETGLLTARYIEYEDAAGIRWFMKSNIYKAPMSEQRIFDLSTAKIARGSNSQRVRVEIETYLESRPQERLSVMVNLVKQDGEWYLDNGTY